MTVPTLIDVLDPWRRPGHLWRAVCHVVLGLATGVVTFTVVFSLLSISAGLLITLPLALPFVWLTFESSRLLARLERSRFHALLGVEIVDAVSPLVETSWWRRLLERVKSAPRWREIGHHVVALPVGVLGYLVLLVTWCGSLAFALLPLYVGALPGGSAKFGVFEVSQGAVAVGLGLLGVVGLVVLAPRATLWVVEMQVWAARPLLGRRREDVLEAEVSRLESSRSAAVDSAESERRRIERDLHDGAQQRLVALAAGLGAAREKFDHDPETARSMVAEAHEEAKSALKEIRDLVRGIHPVILEDRGLDAALSAVVARAPVPVALDVSVTERLPPAIESTAYFVVSEALANVARHAQATRAYVSIARAGDRLVIEVRDDGVGGADASLGTGLQGLRERVTGHGGSMIVLSPPGGPTTLSVELPCGS
jgi:signal transduction histidine kinase